MLTDDLQLNKPAAAALLKNTKFTHFSLGQESSAVCGSKSRKRKSGVVGERERVSGGLRCSLRRFSRTMAGTCRYLLDKLEGLSTRPTFASLDEVSNSCGKKKHLLERKKEHPSFKFSHAPVTL